ncbi:MAG: glycoside hydrolase family 3 N-terminal domain-containing protein [Marinifilaceae bacterium]
MKITIKVLITLSILLLCNSIQANNWADSVLSRMSIDQKIGQLFMIAAYSNKDANYEQQLVNQIQKLQPGGVIFFQGDIKRQIELTNRVQKSSPTPLFVGMDAEHGLGWRLKDGMVFPRMQCVSASPCDTIQMEIGAAIARHLKAVGVHINFAPVVDINNNAANPVIGMRSYGELPATVTRKAHLYARGSNHEKVMPVLKHFPGHGNTDTDSHLSLPVIHTTKDSMINTEFFPYNRLLPLGLPAVMVGHISVPALDSSGLPASVSKQIVTRLLREEMRFNGLTFTDAMNMKGVTTGRATGEADVQALIAGNDIILFPENLDIAIKKVKEAINNGLITQEAIDTRCRRILEAKVKYNANVFTPISYAKIKPLLHTKQDSLLLASTYRTAITLAKNTDNLIPLTHLDKRTIACVVVGKTRATEFTSTLKKYAKIKQIYLSAAPTAEQLSTLKQQLAGINTLIVFNSAGTDSYKSNFGFSTGMKQLLSTVGNGVQTIIVQPTTPYGLKPFVNYNTASWIICYDKTLHAQRYAAQAIFGGIDIQGVLPVSISPEYPAGTGINTSKTRLGYATPEEAGVDSRRLSTIDSICRSAIAKRATPGCQVVVARGGNIIYQKSFGNKTYTSPEAVTDQCLYDVASITKIAATMPVVMQLEQKGDITLDGTIGDYLPQYRESNKHNLKLKDILLHQAGLRGSIPLFAEAIDRKNLRGPLFTAKKTESNTIRVKDRLYMNPNFKYKDSTFSSIPKSNYLSVAPGVYMHPQYKDSLQQAIAKTPVDGKGMRYSDLGFMLLQEVAEQVTHRPLDVYCNEEFYTRMGMHHTYFNPLKNVDKQDIVPSCRENIYRKCTIHGTVHDPVAAVRGGVSGHAGLFSTAGDIAKIMQLYLNGGEYGGEHYFDKETLKRYTRNHLPSNRRAYGFDKPNLQAPQASPAAPSASAESFGHTGFTGTIAWADPKYDLVYVFLSNRTYPDEYNNLLLRLNVRTAVQEVIYNAIQP